MDPHFCNLTAIDVLLLLPHRKTLFYGLIQDRGRNVLAGNMYTYKHYASPSDKTGAKNETVHLALNPWQAVS